MTFYNSRSFLRFFCIIFRFIFIILAILKSIKSDQKGSFVLKTFPFFIFLLFNISAAFANGLALSNMTLVNRDTTAHTYDVQLDITWNNSWFITGAPSSTANWDAAWVFVKYSVWDTGTSAWGDWNHCTLSKTPGNYTAPTGSQIAIGCSPSQTCGGSDAATGVFIYRNAAGTGSVSWSGAKLRWLYGTDGVGDGAQVRIQAFGIETVYIPQGAFYAGSGGTESGSFTNGSWVSGATVPFLISSEATLTIAHTAGNLWGTSTSGPNSIGGAGSLPAAFPKGYAPFYIMKYDLSQGQYRDFLNTLTRTQQNARTKIQTPGGAYALSGAASGADITTCGAGTTPAYMCRNAIRLPSVLPGTSVRLVFGVDYDKNGTPNQSTDGEWIALNWVSWDDQCAYADWAGLRPFTELEYEKAARGPVNPPTANEYAWGSTGDDCTTVYTLTNPGTTSETMSTGTRCTSKGNLGDASTTPATGPLRVGAFAAGAATKNRRETGGSYYGVMELSGNLWKRPVSVGEATVGRLFTGGHGDGSLSVAGAANVSTWPAGATPTGSGFRGGAWYNASAYGRVSDRISAASVNAARYGYYGGRCSRTSP